MPKDPYAELGVDKSASPADVKKAYRKAAKKAHPDQGGSQEAFQRVNGAYLVLSDPESREEFDRTGKTRDRSSTQDATLGQAMQLVASLLSQALGAEEDPGQIGLLNIMADCIKRDLGNKQKKRAQIERAKARAEKMLKQHLKAKKKSERPGVLVGIIESQIRDMTDMVRRGQAEEKVYQVALEIVWSYDFSKDQASTWSPQTSFFIQSFSGSSASGR